MARASFFAVLALLLCSTAACGGADDETGGDSHGVVAGRKREQNTATGGISGDPQAPTNESPSSTGNGSTNTQNDPPSTPSDPPPSSDPPPDPGPDPIPAGSFAVGTELVTTANLNIRDGADTSYPIITTAPNGSHVFVESVSGSGGWVNISWNGSVGWSSKDYLTVP